MEAAPTIANLRISVRVWLLYKASTATSGSFVSSSIVNHVRLYIAVYLLYIAVYLLLLNATMYREEGARRCVYFNPQHAGMHSLVPSPSPQLSSLAVRITLRRPGKNYLVMLPLTWYHNFNILRYVTRWCTKQTWGGLELVWDVYLANFMFRRRQTRTEYKKKDARVEIRVKADGCRALEAVWRSWSATSCCQPLQRLVLKSS